MMFVFGVKYRLGMIDSRWQNQLYAVIGQTVLRCGCHPIAIGGIKDHVHVFLSMGNNAPAPKDVLRTIKSVSSKWINDNHLCLGNFAWQVGGGRFSYSHRDVDMIANYVKNQERHHYNMSFRDEIEKLLRASNIDYQDDYLPSDLE